MCEVSGLWEQAGESLRGGHLCRSSRMYGDFPQENLGSRVPRESPSKAQVSRCAVQNAKEQPVSGCGAVKTGAEAGREAGVGHLGPLLPEGILEGPKIYFLSKSDHSFLPLYTECSPQPALASE